MAAAPPPPRSKAASRNGTTCPQTGTRGLQRPRQPRRSVQREGPAHGEVRDLHRSRTFKNEKSTAPVSRPLLGGLTLNMMYMFTGSAGVNPAYMILEVPLISAWRNAGYFGRDRYALNAEIAEPRLRGPNQMLRGFWCARISEPRRLRAERPPRSISGLSRAGCRRFERRSFVVLSGPLSGRGGT